MAFTLSTIVNTVVGDKRLYVAHVTPDAATGVITVPGAVAVDCILSNDTKSATSLTCVNVAFNVNASGVAANGVVAYSNVATNQVHILSLLYH